MKLKNLFKAVIATAIAIVGFFAVINIGPRVEAASDSYYSNRSFTSKGQSDYGICDGKVIEIKDYYDKYVRYDNNYKTTVDNHTWFKNKGWDNYIVKQYKIGDRLSDKWYEGLPGKNAYIDLFGNDPITAFVDKECFITPGDYMMIGDEYGYYIHTELGEYSAYTFSVVLLFNITVFKDSSSSFRYDIDIISQTAYVTLQYDKAYNNTCHSLEIEVMNEKGYSKLTDGSINLLYRVNSTYRPADGYIVAPVLDGRWMDLKDHVQIALYEVLYLSPYFFDTSLTSQSNVKIDELSIHRAEGTRLIYHNEENYDSFIERMYDKYSEELAEKSIEEIRARLISKVPYGSVINTIIDFSEIALGFVGSIFNEFNGLGRDVIIPKEQSFSQVSPIQPNDSKGRFCISEKLSIVPSSDDSEIKNDDYNSFLIGTNSKNSNYDTNKQQFIHYLVKHQNPTQSISARTDLTLIPMIRIHLSTMKDELGWRNALVPGVSNFYDAFSHNVTGNIYAVDSEIKRMNNGNFNNSLCHTRIDDLSKIKKSQNEGTSVAKEINFSNDTTIENLATYEKPTYYKIRANESGNYSLRVSCNQFTPVTLKIWESQSSTLVASFTNTTEIYSTIYLDSKKYYFIEMVYSYRYYTYSETNKKFLETLKQKAVIKKFNGPTC